MWLCARLRPGSETFDSSIDHDKGRLNSSREDRSIHGSILLESRVTLARAEQVKPIPFSIRAHSARASLGLPKIAYLSAGSISAAAVAISLPLCNLSKLIAT